MDGVILDKLSPTYTYKMRILFKLIMLVYTSQFYMIREGINTKRMRTLIKTKFRKSDDQTNIVAANITEYHIISKLIFPKNIIQKFMEKRQLFHVKNVCKNVKNQ